MRSHIKTVLLFLVVALLIAWFVGSLDARQIAEARGAVAAADKSSILIGVLLICTTYFLRALRWRVLLRRVAPARLDDLFAATTIGFASVFLVGRAGELLRPAFLTARDPRIPAPTSFMTIAVERVCDMAAIALMFALALPFVSGTDAESDSRLVIVRQAGIVVLAGAIAGIICLLLARRFMPRITAYLDARAERGGGGFAAKFTRTLADLLRQFADALGVFGDVRSLLATIAWTAVLWCTVVVINLIVLRAFGLNVGVAGTIFVLGCSLVGSLVPAPGGAAGTYHAAIAGGLALLGADQEQALAAAFVLHLVVWSPALPFGIYYFVRSGARLGRLREIANRRAEEDGAASADHQGLRATN